MHRSVTGGRKHTNRRLALLQVHEIPNQHAESFLLTLQALVNNTVRCTTGEQLHYPLSHLESG